MLENEDILEMEKLRYRVVGTIIRRKQSFVVEYRTLNLIIYHVWKPVVMCDTFDECVEKIERLIKLRISKF